MCQQCVSTPPAIVPGLAGHSLLELKDCWKKLQQQKCWPTKGTMETRLLQQTHRVQVGPGSSTWDIEW